MDRIIKHFNSTYEAEKMIKTGEVAKGALSSLAGLHGAM
jgi:hypothetical protein